MEVSGELVPPLDNISGNALPRAAHTAREHEQDDGGGVLRSADVDTDMSDWNLASVIVGAC